ncbi:hypothetical protein ACIRPQ_03840 [Streptomyces sp. NPDC101213]|uniref:hypothetical protein n=1 Tax=unclassified Streptomyces TaxID=2593676 RepID=UPI0036FDEDD2
MPNETPNGHFRAGQLGAALWVLRRLAVPDAKAPEESGFRGKKVPVQLLAGDQASLMKHLLLARRHGGARWEAATEVFRDIPDLLPSHLPGHTMEPGEENAFVAGHQQQIAAYKEKFGALVGDVAG